MLNFIKAEPLEMIEWAEDSCGTLPYRFPDNAKETKNGAQLIVREPKQVQLVSRAN